MTTNKLKLNPDKTEFILVGNKSQRKNFVVFFPVDILGSTIGLMDKAHNLGVIFYSGFSFSSHESYQASSHWKHSSHRGQWLAHIVKRSSKFTHISPVLISLHWLSVRHRICFKTASIIYKFLHIGVRAYFSPHFVCYTCQVDTRCSRPDNLYLHVPVYKPSLNKSKVHLQLSQLRWSFVEFSTSRSSFCPNSIMFQTKAKGASFSGWMFALAFSTRQVYCLDHKLFPA